MTMQFGEYLRKNNITQEEAATALGVKQSACSLWIAGKRIPRAGNMKKILAWSGGQVTANDFFMKVSEA